ncbi:MAG: hypothetical protein OEW64_11960 [Gammaproteobacteria bacterium]|nr:hypothetical protein [Gammaproteobacteria bacterium]
MKASEIDGAIKDTLQQEQGFANDCDYARRPRLTLRHLNKLNKIRELRKFEMAQKRAEIHDMYGDKPDSLECSKPAMIPRETN